MKSTMNELSPVALGPHLVSRLIIGGNPISGNSHQGKDRDREMVDWFTAERIKQTLRRCEENGINTIQARGDAHITRLLNEYWNEGGRIQWIAQTASEIADFEGNVRRILQFNPVAVYHHGTKADNLWAQRKIDELRDRVQFLHDNVPVAGLGTHLPEVVEYAEEHAWPVDFYMTCMYAISRKERPLFFTVGHHGGWEQYADEDRDAMCRVIRQVQKPCLAFKILGAGRKCATSDDVRAAFEFTFNNIKPTDAVVVGIFPKDKDQVAENAAIVRDICSRMGARIL